MYFYSYLPKTNVLPVCFNGNIRVPLDNLNDEGFEKYKSDRHLRFEFTIDKDEVRVYQVEIQNIGKTSLQTLRKDKNFRSRLIKNSDAFLKFYRTTREEYDFDNPEDDSADFIRTSSVRSTYDSHVMR